MPPAPRQGDVLVKAEDVQRSYASGTSRVVALRPTDCVVRAGDRIAITGRSGSGKSTLLHLLAGLDQPSGGTVSWPGLGGSVRHAPGRIGMVFQGPSLLPGLDVLENTALPLLLAGVEPTAARARAFDALRVLDLEALSRQLPEELSGGQAQRVALARAMTSRPRLVIADEPTGQLDRDNGRHVLDVLFQAADEVGAAVLISTHDGAVAQRFATRWTMDDGCLTAPPASAPSRPAASGDPGAARRAGSSGDTKEPAW